MKLISGKRVRTGALPRRCNYFVNNNYPADIFKAVSTKGFAQSGV